MSLKDSELYVNSCALSFLPLSHSFPKKKSKCHFLKNCFLFACNIFVNLSISGKDRVGVGYTGLNVTVMFEKFLSFKTCELGVSIRRQEFSSL